MARTIDGDALIAWIKGSQQMTSKMKSIICYIKTMPTIDAVSVVHGEWIFKTVFPNDKSEFPMGYLVCSVCGSHHSNSTPCNYCDNCGAKMKGADDEESV